VPRYLYGRLIVKVKLLSGYLQTISERKGKIIEGKSCGDIRSAIVCSPLSSCEC